MKYLIVGLGNPGVKYENTRHNIGFRVLDKLVSLSNTSFFNDRYADICEIIFKGRTLILVKPSTFMNLSGKAVRYWLQKTKIKQENLLVITDDISLPFGVLRLRKKGSAGGHNGLKNIQDFLEDVNYCRLRFGVGNDFSRGRQVDYVLSDFSNSECQIMDDRIEIVIKMIQGFATIGVDRTMSDLNGK
ncbi:MAG: aminoacyl-tRNA hydrolase [Bacteroidota bacterium]|nr:aminoacyl-tRNA hydrolase [Bacteroidota bacterium]